VLLLPSLSDDDNNDIGIDKMYTTKSIRQVSEPRAADSPDEPVHKVEIHADVSEGDDKSLRAPSFQKVIWYKEPNLRKLYGWVLVLMVASATTGYDGYVSVSKEGEEAGRGRGRGRRELTGQNH
jgi:hypothetical protein